MSAKENRADLDGGGPVGVHLSVLVVVTLKLQLQVGPEEKTHILQLEQKQMSLFLFKLSRHRPQ